MLWLPRSTKYSRLLSYKKRGEDLLLAFRVDGVCGGQELPFMDSPTGDPYVRIKQEGLGQVLGFSAQGRSLSSGSLSSPALNSYAPSALLSGTAVLCSFCRRESVDPDEEVVPLALGNQPQMWK